MVCGIDFTATRLDLDVVHAPFFFWCSRNIHVLFFSFTWKIKLKAVSKFIFMDSLFFTEKNPDWEGSVIIRAYVYLQSMFFPTNAALVIKYRKQNININKVCSQFLVKPVTPGNDVNSWDTFTLYKKKIISSSFPS